MTSAIHGAINRAKNTYEAAYPIKASLRPLDDLNLPRAWHSLAVVDGRAYIFGGKTDDERLAGNGVDVVILPSSGVVGTDFRALDATAASPSARWMHAACVVGKDVFVFGGSTNDSGEPVDEHGRVWVFHTPTESWSYLDPPSDGKVPPPRVLHAMVACERPEFEQERTDKDVPPNRPVDPAKIVPHVPSAASYGTLVIKGGQNAAGQAMNDVWAFNVSSRTWTPLPEPPPPVDEAPCLTIVNQRIYTFSRGQTTFLELAQSSVTTPGWKKTTALIASGSWNTLPPTPSSPELSHPGDRINASLIHVPVIHNRNYLLLIGGQTTSGHQLEDAWILQVQSDASAGAWIKDAVNNALKREPKDPRWEEIKYTSDESGYSKKGIGSRRGLAVAKGSEVDGANAIIWGGIAPDGKVHGDGVMVTVNR